jgi:hypothetical protein
MNGIQRAKPFDKKISFSAKPRNDLFFRGLRPQTPQKMGLE